MVVRKVFLLLLAILIATTNANSYSCTSAENWCSSTETCCVSKDRQRIGCIDIADGTCCESIFPTACESDSECLADGNEAGCEANISDGTRITLVILFLGLSTASICLTVLAIRKMKKSHKKEKKERQEADYAHANKNVEMQGGYQGVNPGTNQGRVQEGIPVGGQGGYQNGSQGGYQGGYQGGAQGGYQGGAQGGYQGGPQGNYQGGYQGSQGNYQGGAQGGYQGGPQGGYQGGPQGNYQGGGYQGGPQGGGYQGGPQGGYQGGPQGGYQGGYQGGPKTVNQTIVAPENLNLRPNVQKKFSTN